MDITAPITYINPNTYLADIVDNTTPTALLSNSFDTLTGLTGTYGAGKRSYTLIIVSGEVIIDGDTVSVPMSPSFGLGDQSTQAGVTYDATNGELYGLTIG